MYTLRTIDEGCRTKVYNQNLGENYTTVYNKQEESDNKRLSKANDDYEVLSKKCIVNENTYAILVADNGKIIIPLFSGNEYFIMTENGKTFERL